MNITDEQIDTLIDLYMIHRGDHPTRTRNPIYGEERQLAKNVAKQVVELLKKDEEKILIKFMQWRSQQCLSLLYGIPNYELIQSYLRGENNPR